MQKSLIIFGAGSIAKLAAWYFSRNPDYDLKGFCVDDAYFISQGTHSLPLIPFSSLVDLYPPHVCQIFVGLGYQKLNSIRAATCRRFLDLGYTLVSCISNTAVIMSDCMPGYNSFIMAGTIIEPYTRIGSNCICWSGSVIAHESIIEDNCFLAAGAVVGGMARMGRNSFLGINAIIQNRVAIGENCLVGAGCVVRENLPAETALSAPAATKSRFKASETMRFLDL